jgi:hypothetical protein
MIIPAISVLIAATAPAFGMLVGAPNRRVSHDNNANIQVQRFGEVPVPEMHINQETGLIKSWWSANDLDSSILRQAIESGDLMDAKHTRSKRIAPAVGISPTSA